MKYTLILPAIFLISACSQQVIGFDSAPTRESYSEPHISGLSAIQPFPSADDVCQMIREDEKIRAPATDGSFLIACPKHERGAIGDRISEGAVIIEHAHHWTILSVPNE